VTNLNEEWRKKKKLTKEEKKEAELRKRSKSMIEKRKRNMSKSDKKRLDIHHTNEEEEEFKDQHFAYVFASGSFVLFDSNLILQQGKQKLNLYEFEDIDNRVLC